MIWPAERFFWAVVEAPGIRAGILPAGLWPALEEDVPVPPESLWAVVTPIDREKALVCAVRKSELASLDPSTLVLTPESVPGFAGTDIDPPALNLLIGEFEPRHVRAVRIRRHLGAAAVVLACIALIGTGLIRRARVWNTEAGSARAAARALVDSLSPALGWSEADLVMELENRRQAVPQDLRPPGDAAAAVAAFIGRWPTLVASKPQGMLVTGDSASVSVTVPGDPSVFLAALKAPEGWILAEPRLATVDKTTRLTLEFRRARP